MPKILKPGQRISIDARRVGEMMSLKIALGGALFEVAMEPLDVLRLSSSLREAVAKAFPIGGADD